MGLANYGTALTDPDFLASLRNIALFGLGPTVILIVSVVVTLLYLRLLPVRKELVV